MPSRLCWKVGIIWQLQAGRLGRFKLAEAEEVWSRGMDRGDGVVLGSEREAPQVGAGGVSPSFK